MISVLYCLLQLLLRLQRVESLVNQQQHEAAGKPGGGNLLLGLAKAAALHHVLQLYKELQLRCMTTHNSLLPPGVISFHHPGGQLSWPMFAGEAGEPNADQPEGRHRSANRARNIPVQASQRSTPSQVSRMMCVPTQPQLPLPAKADCVLCHAESTAAGLAAAPGFQSPSSPQLQHKG